MEILDIRSRGLASFDACSGDWSSPFSGLPGFSAEAHRRRLRGLVSKALESAESVALAAQDGGGVIGFAACEPNAWESAFFGRRMFGLTAFRAGSPDAARTLLRELLSRASWDTVTAKADPLDLGALHALEQAGFRLMDTNLMCAFQTSPQCLEIQAKEGLDVSPARTEDLEAVKAITRNSFKGYRSRFTDDSRLPAAARSSFYEVWAENSMNGFANLVLVARFDGRPAGYITAIRNAEAESLVGCAVGQVGLAGVDPAFQGRGLYETLQRHALKWACEQGMQFVLYVTHLGNRAVQRRLCTLGYFPLASRHSLHLHRENLP